MISMKSFLRRFKKNILDKQLPLSLILFSFLALTNNVEASVLFNNGQLSTTADYSSLPDFNVSDIFDLTSSSKPAALYDEENNLDAALVSSSSAYHLSNVLERIQKQDIVDTEFFTPETNETLLDISENYALDINFGARTIVGARNTITKSALEKFLGRALTDEQYQTFLNNPQAMADLKKLLAAKMSEGEALGNGDGIGDMAEQGQNDAELANAHNSFQSFIGDLVGSSDYTLDLGSSSHTELASALFPDLGSSSAGGLLAGTSIGGVASDASNDGLFTRLGLAPSRQSTEELNRAIQAEYINEDPDSAANRIASAQQYNDSAFSGAGGVEGLPRQIPVDTATNTGSSRRSERSGGSEPSENSHTEGSSSGGSSGGTASIPSSRDSGYSFSSGDRTPSSESGSSNGSHNGSSGSNDRPEDFRAVGPDGGSSDVGPLASSGSRNSASVSDTSQAPPSQSTPQPNSIGPNTLQQDAIRAFLGEYDRAAGVAPGNSQSLSSDYIKDRKIALKEFQDGSLYKNLSPAPTSNHGREASDLPANVEKESCSPSEISSINSKHEEAIEKAAIMASADLCSTNQPQYVFSVDTVSYSKALLDFQTMSATAQCKKEDADRISTWIRTFKASILNNPKLCYELRTKSVGSDEALEAISKYVVNEKEKTKTLAAAGKIATNDTQASAKGLTIEGTPDETYGSEGIDKNPVAISDENGGRGGASGDTRGSDGAHTGSPGPQATVSSADSAVDTNSLVAKNVLELAKLTRSNAPDDCLADIVNQIYTIENFKHKIGPLRDFVKSEIGLPTVPMPGNEGRKKAMIQKMEVFNNRLRGDVTESAKNFADKAVFCSSKELIVEMLISPPSSEKWDSADELARENALKGSAWLHGQALAGIAEQMNLYDRSTSSCLGASNYKPHNLKNEPSFKTIDVSFAQAVLISNYSSAQVTEVIKSRNNGTYLAKYNEYFNSDNRAKGARECIAELSGSEKFKVAKEESLRHFKQQFAQTWMRVMGRANGAMNEISESTPLKENDRTPAHVE